MDGPRDQSPTQMGHPPWTELDRGMRAGLALLPEPRGRSNCVPRAAWLWRPGLPSTPVPQPGAPLTALAGRPALGGALVQGLLLAVVVFVCFAVSARTGADAALEGPAAQHLPAIQGHSQNSEI